MKKENKIFEIKRDNYIKDKNSNINSLTKQNISAVKKNLKLNEIIPQLQNIKFRFSKRENVDKKIIKLFKNFIKNKIKQDKMKSEEMKNLSFWNRYVQGMYTPPFYYVDECTNKTIEFKSSNSIYILWIFQNELSNELYTLFLQEKGNNLIDSFVDFFDITESEDIKMIKYYIFNFNKIFSLAKGKIIFLKNNFLLS
jgi:ferric iron reductase protein FhuF